MIELFFHGGHISWQKYWVQKLIQVATDSEYWHVDVRYDDKLYVGASRSYGGLDIRPLKLMKPMTPDCYIRRANLLVEVDEEKFFDRLFAQYGNKFSMSGIFYLFLLKMTGNRLEVNDWFNSNGSVICAPTLGEVIIETARRRREIKALAEIPFGCISPAALTRWEGIEMGDIIDVRNFR